MPEHAEMGVKSHDLFDFMVSIAAEMTREYERIQKRATEDPGTAGDQGEENWATLLRNWIPPAYQVVTKGRILGHQGIASPQVDVIVLSPSYPRHLLDKKLYLAGGVAAAFECKLTLRTGHLEKAFRNAAEIRRLLQPRIGSPYVELNSPIVYGVFAHSHEWHSKRPEHHAMFHISRELQSWRQAGIEHPREMLDIVCVADLGAFTANKLPFQPDLEHTTGSRGPVGVGYTQWIPSRHWAISPDTVSQDTQFEPIGTALCALLYKLGWEDKNLRRLAEYFNLTGIRGVGIGSLTGWPISVYSEEVRTALFTKGLNAFQDWGEWSAIFPF